ncbi:septum formation initiator family protein [Nocardioides sp.]|uniref:FtsB family cell division protein n=2 Tax=Nocardioides sp. TaxID=35761 RepID=UPI00321B960E
MPAPPRKPVKPARTDPRRSASTRARSGSSGPGRASGPRTNRTARPSSSGRSRQAAPVRVAAPAPKPRLTGRAAILVLVLAVLAVSYASSLRAYLQQRGQIESLQTTISEREAQIADLEQERSRWDDPEYVETEARERLGYVRPGETPFVALRDGAPLQPESELTDPATIAPSEPRAFWDDAWETVLVAGDPQRRADPPPLTRIQDPEGAPQESDE